MATVSDSVWNDVLGQIKLNHPQLVRGWFSQLIPADLARGVLSVRAQNTAQSRYLEKHCRAAFAEAAQAATGRLVSVEFETDGAADTAGAGLDRLDEAFLLLNDDNTFENFVIGPCNRLAHAAAVAVAEDPGRCYNPFFIHGAVGLGKTHLLQAVCHTVKKGNPDARCHYISCEMFTNDFIEAVEQGALHEFRYRYRNADILVIDDVQFLAARERSQEEFFHTFNTLAQSHRQIVLSADSSPVEIPSLEERLVSRFNSGLVALLDRPCLETRMAIVQKKAKLRCIEVPEEVVRFIASRVDTNSRELEGALIKVDAVSQTEGKTITLPLARLALGVKPSRTVTIPDIMEAVSKRMVVKISDLQGKRRLRTVSLPRQVCMYLAREMTSHSLEQIGGYFGGRDHTTVLHAHRTITQLLETDEELGRNIEQIQAEVFRDA